MKIKTKEERRADAISKAMELWAIYGPSYSTNVGTYKFLLQRRRELKIQPLRRIPDEILKEYPDIPFLKIRASVDAKEYLEDLEIVQIKNLIRKIEYVINWDYAYQTVVSRIRDFEYQCRHYGEQKNPYSVNPDCCGNGQGMQTYISASKREVKEKE